MNAAAILRKLPRKAGVALRFARSRFTANSALLLYHRVAEDAWDPFRLCVSPVRFEEQLACLKETAEVLPIETFVRRQREGSLAAGSVALTFDDGYLDFAETALPLLEAFEIPAVLYCVSGGLGEPLWWDRLHDSLCSCLDSEHPPERIDLASDAGQVSVVVRGLDPASAFDRLYPHFQSLPPAARSEQLEALGRTTGLDPGGVGDAAAPSRRLLSAEEIARLAAHPLVTIGAHTVSHSSLAGLAPAAQFAEIDASMRTLREIAGQRIATFSYPYGLRGRDYTAETISAAARAGLDHALAADQDVVSTRSDPMALPRLWVHDRDGETFRKGLQNWLGRNPTA